jgi:hypothetical protein
MCQIVKRFSIDIVAVLTESVNSNGYGNTLKSRLQDLGRPVVSAQNYRALKRPAARLNSTPPETDVASTAFPRCLTV